MAIIKEQIPIHKKWLTVNSTRRFKIKNNYGDEIEKLPGLWQINCYELLPEKFQKQFPTFELYIEYDDSLLGHTIWSQTNIELDSVTTQSTNIDYSSEIDTINNNVGSVEQAMESVDSSMQSVDSSMQSVKKSLDIQTDILYPCYNESSAIVGDGTINSLGVWLKGSTHFTKLIGGWNYLRKNLKGSFTVVRPNVDEVEFDLTNKMVKINNVEYPIFMLAIVETSGSYRLYLNYINDFQISANVQFSPNMQVTKCYIYV